MKNQKAVLISKEIHKAVKLFTTQHETEIGLFTEAALTEKMQRDDKITAKRNKKEFTQ